MQYEVYRNKAATDEEFEAMDQFFKQVESEDKALCTAAQKNLNAGYYVSGPLHPFNEKGVLHFQQTLKEILLKHREEEQKAGCDIWPARQNTSNFLGLAGELQFCNQLSCEENPAISW